MNRYKLNNFSELCLARIPGDCWDISPLKGEWPTHSKKKIIKKNQKMTISMKMFTLN